MATIKNEGSTCYINSVIQMLLTDEDFIICLDKEEYKRIINLYKRGNILSIIDFLSYYKRINRNFIIGEQGDSDECLTYLLDDLTDKSLFQIKIKQKIYTKNGNVFDISEMITYENFISLPFRDSLQESINSLFSQKDEEKYIDNGIEIYSPKIEYEPCNSPKFLFIHLKRFDFMNNRKIDNDIIIHNYVLYYGKKYEIISYIIHIGDFYSGHYITIKKYDNKWILFDDARSQGIINQEDVNKFQSIGYIFLLKIIDDANFNEEQIIKYSPDSTISETIVIEK